MENKKRVITMIGIGAIMLLLIGATYAYFAAQNAESKSRDVRITTATTDSLVFEIGKDLEITANQENFAQGKGNRSDTTTATATLKANSATNNAVAYYNMHLEITNNTFKYTTSSKTAEVILTITKPDKTLLTKIPGLNYVTVGSVSGFDITTETGLIRILEEYEIISTGTKIDEWEVSVTLVNLDSDQSANAGSELTATLKMQEAAEIIITSLADVCSSGDNLAGCIKTYSDNYAYEDSKILHHTSALANSAEDNSYRYAGTNIYELGLDNLPGHWKYEELELMGQKGTVVYNTNDAGIDKVQGVIEKVKNGTFVQTDLEGMTFQEYPEGSGVYLLISDIASILTEINELYVHYNDNIDLSIFGIMDLPESFGFSKIYYYLDDEQMVEIARIIDKYKISPDSLTPEEGGKISFLTLTSIGYPFFTSADNAMNDAYKKGLISESKVIKNINNYVCFGSNDAICPDENLYQIIGSFNNQAKLVKSIPMLDISWGTIETYGADENSNWKNSTINNYLNTTYLNSLGAWSDKISTHTWSVGGATYEANKTAKSYYDEETDNSVTYSAKIGLPYVHEFEYANENFQLENIDNWLGGYDLWSMSLEKDEYEMAQHLRIFGLIEKKGNLLFTYESWSPDGILGIKPTFYLNNDVTYVKGIGTRTNPYRIN